MLSTAFNDAPQAALGFLQSQVSHIEKTVWETVYPEITYPEVVPTTNEANDWAKTVTYYSSNKRGRAEFIANRGRDIPMSGTDMEQHETEIRLAAAGYDYDLETLNQARMLGQNLPAMNAVAARRSYEELVEEVAYEGHAQSGFEGLFNTASVAVIAVVNGGGGTPQWATKTHDEILTDVNTILSGTWVNTLGIEMCDTLLIPLAQFSDIVTRRIGPDTETTIFEYIMKKNIYTVKTGKALTIKSLFQLAGAGAGGLDRAVAYRRDPSGGIMHIPMALKFLAPQQVGLVFEVPGIFRLGGVDIRRPGAFRYFDGI